MMYAMRTSTLRPGTVEEFEARFAQRAPLPGEVLDIIANNMIDQKVVELSSSQHYSLGENSMYCSAFLPQGV